MIDIVLPYVNNHDKEWIDQYNKYVDTIGDKSPNRFRDADTLKYWFRSIDTMCKFPHRIVLVVASLSQIPTWLNTSHVLVKTHDEFIPHSELPTFNSSVISSYIPFIKDLSDQYVIFDDDMFVVRPINDTTFFINNQPAIFYEFNRFDASRGMWFAKINLCQDIISNWLHTKCHVIPEHAPMPHIKSIDLYIWYKLHDVLSKSLKSSRFRRDGNVMHWIFNIAYYGLHLVRPTTKPICTYYNTDKISIPQNTSVACYNDTELITDFNSYKTSLTNLLSTVCSDPSTYEV